MEEISDEEFLTKMVKGFEQSMGTSFISGDLIRQEISWIEDNITKRYSKKEWTEKFA
jgi:lipoate-protein ligase A